MDYQASAYFTTYAIKNNQNKISFTFSVCSLLMVSILHLLATFVSWIFMIIVSIVSVAGTALLWYTYHELRTKQRSFDGSFLAVSIIYM